MKRLLGGLALGLAAACTGLLVDKGNAYPCDFSEPEGERDRACPPGFVCGVNDLCHRFQYEGPQFEGVPPSPVLDGGALVFPRLLRGPVTAVLPDALGDRHLAALVAQNGGELYELTGALQVEKKGTPPPGVTSGGSFEDGLLVLFENGRAALLSEGKPPEEVQTTAPVTFEALRIAHPEGAGSYAAALLPASSGPAGEVVRMPSGELRLRPFTLSFSTDAGVMTPAPREVRWFARGLLERPSAGPELVPVVLAPPGFFYRKTRGADLDPTTDQWVRLNPDEELWLPGPHLFRHNRAGTLWAVATGDPREGASAKRPQVLSTWRLARTSAGTSVERAWTDCRPCGGGHIVTFTPVVLGETSVEVLCEANQTATRSIVRVTGALTPTPLSPCVTEPVAEPIPLADLSVSDGGRYVVDQTLGGLQVLGGRHGQLWGGDRLSTLAPHALDRVPLALGTVDLPDAGFPGLALEREERGRQPMAITDRAFALPVSPNGYASLRLEELSEWAFDLQASPRAPIGEGSGWLILSTADLARVSLRPDAGSPIELGFGPRLVDGRGAPAREPFFGEAFLDEQGKLVSVILTADDSLYFYPDPAEPKPTANALPPLSPQLTPEPGFPIRSMTLERSALGTDGVRYVRGYLVTSRNLYEYTLGGQPARWSARALVLSPGEPVEVWMDHPKGGLGRVGYRDGTVFTLPGGFPLVAALTAADGGTDRVLDYENLGGWPVALAESGLHVAQWDRLPDGGLDRQFPDGGPGRAMTWRPVTLPDGGQPWRGGAGRLHVLRRPPVVEGETKATTFVLFVYAEHGRVYEVGSLTRYDTVR